MNFIALLNSRSKFFLTLIILLGFISSFWNLGLLYLINNRLVQKPILFFPGRDSIVFFVILLASFFVKRYFQRYIIKLTNDVVYEHSIAIIEKVRFAAFENVEKMGKEKLYTAVKYARDVGAFPLMFVHLFNSIIVISCCLIYMFFIYPLGAIVCLCLILGLFTLFFLANKKIENDYFKLRLLEENYFRNLEDLMSGHKEIKMSIPRSKNIYEKFLYRNRREAKELSRTTSVKYGNNDLIASYSWFIGIGAILYIFPSAMGMKTDQMTSFVVTILYIIGPVSSLTSSISVFTQLKIAFNCLIDFDKDLNWVNDQKVEKNETDWKGTSFNSVKFENVTYEYTLGKSQEKVFEFGPVDIDINRNEIIFITGSNGSGKSTFINLLSGLYQPKAGALYMNGIKVDGENSSYYRNQFAAIYTSAYLFNDNYNDFNLKDDERKINKYVEKMKLTDKIRIINEKGIIDSKLSKGQQKRVAMIYALMEEKEVFIFDEWAAEQDPKFRIFFYTEFLPELKRDGKTVIAVTHDDEYYSYADRVIKFDYGKIKQN